MFMVLDTKISILFLCNTIFGKRGDRLTPLR